MGLGLISRGAIIYKKVLKCGRKIDRNFLSDEGVSGLSCLILRVVRYARLYNVTLTVGAPGPGSRRVTGFLGKMGLNFARYVV